MNLCVVFDSSSLVGAALRPWSVPGKALDHALEHCDVCGSIGTFIELEEVLFRKKFDSYMRREDREKFLAFLRNRIRLISVTMEQVNRIQPLCRDWKDNEFLAVAQTAQANIIVSSDADLLVLHPWNGIAILTPSQFLARDLPASI